MKLPFNYTPLSLSEAHRRRAARTLPFFVESTTAEVAYSTKNDEDTDEVMLP